MADKPKRGAWKWREPGGKRKGQKQREEIRKAGRRMWKLIQEDGRRRREREQSKGHT
jgi:hypothetical protein